MNVKLTSGQIADEIKWIQGSDFIVENVWDLYFQEAASVLTWFEPETLNARNLDLPESEIRMGWADYFTFCSPVKNKPRGNWWKLRDPMRVQALNRLESKKRFKMALDLNPERTVDGMQILYEKILTGRKIEIDQLSREDLVQLTEILNWTKGADPNTALLKKIKQAIPLADLLAPMQKLAMDNFVGRRKQLTILEKYLGVSSSEGLIGVTSRFIKKIFSDLKNDPPLLVFGPGGVGKSTLLSRFILEHVKPEEPGSLPFAYLDVDRAIIDPENPNTFIFEAARQLATQCPQQKENLDRFRKNFELQSRSYSVLESSKYINTTSDAYIRFGEIVKTIESPVLIVIDTFEEVQFLGTELVNEIWQFLVALQKIAPNLRTIVAGRSPVKEFPVQNLELPDLDRTEAAQLLSTSLSGLDMPLKRMTEIINNIMDVVGLNPLSLQLACAVVRQEGIEKLMDMGTKSWLIFKVKSEIVQARLYGRILAHIHDNDVRKLAYPGLIVRRISADIIMEVLANPCGLDIKTIEQAQNLLYLLSREGALVERDPEDESVRHRQNVRKMMIADLKNVIAPATIADIHERAIVYYSKKTDRISRAELIYHLLAKGDGLEDAKKLWRDGLDARLANSLDELPAAEKIWLSEKLGVTPNKQLLKDADLQHWEEITTRSVQRLIQSGNANEALKLLREREERSTSSPLFRIELEVLRTLGLYLEAEVLSKKYLSLTAGKTEPELYYELLMQAALTQEAMGNINDALGYVIEAAAISLEKLSLNELRILITHIRLLRKLGDEGNSERNILIGRAMKITSDPMLTVKLSETPVLLRETAAELGEVQPEFLDDAINRIGIEILNDLHMEKISEGLYNWNDALKINSTSALGELAERAGLKYDSISAWMDFVHDSGFSSLTGSIQNWRKELGARPDATAAVSNFDKVLVDLFRKNVDATISRSDEETGSTMDASYNM